MRHCDVAVFVVKMNARQRNPCLSRRSLSRSMNFLFETSSDPCMFMLAWHAFNSRVPLQIDAEARGGSDAERQGCIPDAHWTWYVPSKFGFGLSQYKPVSSEWK